MSKIQPVEAAELTTPFPAHEPLGKGQGLFPGRVVWQHDPVAVSWDGVDYWWKPKNFRADVIIGMVRQGIMRLTGQNSPALAWNALFSWRNAQNGKTGGYRPGQKIAIKPNMNGAGEYNDDPHGNIGVAYANPVVLCQLILSLVQDGGVNPTDITVYDTTRIFPDYMQAMCTAGPLRGVNFSYRDPLGKNLAMADQDAKINWSGPVKGEETYFPVCVTRADYLINLANLKGHSWGLTLTAKNHFGSFINSDMRNTPQTAGLHPNIINGQMGDYSVLADLIAQKTIWSKTILWILDAIITATSETRTITPANATWTMAPFNNYFAASLFFSQDPIALDSVGADFLVNEPVMRANNGNMVSNHGMENYLHEAARINNPPSGTKYMGEYPASLGVHEHWNNARDKQYSRNRGETDGIELIYN